MRVAASQDTLALFDLDGTLLSAADEVHHAAFDHALRATFGVDASVSGIDKAAALDRVLALSAAVAAGVDPARAEAGLPAVMATMGRYYRLRVGPGARTERVLPGVVELLRRLKATGVSVAVATGSARAVAEAKLRAADLDGYFPIGAFGDEVDSRAELLRRALHVAGETYGRRFLSANAVVIGDSPGDIHAAREIGARVVAVATGRFSSRQLDEHGPDFTFPHLDSPDAVIRALRGEVGRA